MAAIKGEAPPLARTSLGTMDDDRHVFQESQPFQMTTLAPDVFPAPPANIQFTRTSITGVADEDDDSDDLKDPEKGEVRFHLMVTYADARLPQSNCPWASSPSHGLPVT